MNRIAPFIALGLVGIAVTACTSPPFTNGEHQIVNIEQAYPVVVEPQVATLVVSVDAGLQSIGRGEEERVRAFVDHWKLRGQGMLNAAAPAGTPNQGSAAAALSQLKKVLASQGVPKGSVQYSSYRPPADDVDAPITLSFVTYVASAAECGVDWTQNLAFTPRNLPWPDFGCSTQRNLAAAVSDPRDLIEPHATDFADAGRRSTVLEKYRRGENTRTTADLDADSGVVSKVAN